MARTAIGRPITSLGQPPRAHPSPPRRAAPQQPFAASEHTAARGLANARGSATRFFDTYLAFLYGQGSPDRFAPIDRQLRSRLRSGQALITPAERAARPHVTNVTVATAGPPVSAIATATIDAGDNTIHLTVALEPRGRRWIVTSVGG